MDDSKIYADSAGSGSEDQLAGSIGHEDNNASDVDELVEHKLSEGESSSGEDEDSIFVAEDEYAPLEDTDSSTEHSAAGAAAIDDKFQCPPADMAPSDAQQLPFDLEQELDSRIEADIAAKQRHETVDAAGLRSDSNGACGTSTAQLHCAAPIEVGVSRVEKMSDEHIGQIKSIMAGIQLSDGAIPEWSRRVPEGAWMPRRKTVSSAQPPSATNSSSSAK
ncbi:hypothetical protein H4R26_003223 [Coemansia thaxteri]|uniref:Uncharacterized protein n=1 Tax=Coemansia thaxteri TaxID=2663907 RepID=A0A9W8BD08_9FUNG|nr:hypothetical protein H4R26_003223 [Coemansia thaxteri]